MKKTFKRAGVAVLSMAMLLSIGAVGAMSASAVSNTVKVNNIPKYVSGKSTTENDATATVSIYQVAYRDDTGTWKWVSGYGSGNVEDLSTKTAEQMNELANGLVEKVSDNSKVGTGTTNATNITLASTEYVNVDRVAYYLVVTTPRDNTINVQPTLIQIDGTKVDSKEITPKVNTVPIDKKVEVKDEAQGANSSDKESAVAVLGATLNYSIETKLPAYETGTNGAKVTGDKIKDFVITDDPADGILIDNTNFTSEGSNVVVKINNKVVYENGVAKSDGEFTLREDGDAGKAGTYSVEVQKEEDGFKVTIPGEIVYGKGGQTVTVTFVATVDDDATTGSEANNNTAKITYGNNFATGGGSAEKSDTVPVYTGEIDILKQGLNAQGEVSVATLDGAHFKLQKLNTTTNQYDDVTNLTDINALNGKFQFGYLSAGTYKLTETQAPQSYKTTGEEFIFTVTEKTNASDAQYNQYTVAGMNTSHFVMSNQKKDSTGSVENVKQITVTNPPANSLPGTGGMGTVLFTVGGAAIVLAAGAMFVVYMRKRKNEE